MATAYITIGCPTTGGGKVLTGNSSFLIEGIPIACIGDTASCPTHKTVATIVSGDPHMQVFGRAAARANDSLSCGCKLLPMQSRVVSDTGFGMGGMSGSSVNDAQSNFKDSKPVDHDTQIQFKTVNGDLYAGVKYKLKLSDGSTRQGTTDADGKTARIETHGPVKITQATFYGEKSNRFIPKKKNDINFSTNTNGIGSSFEVSTLEISKRPLTQGELNIAQQVFKSSVDYSKVFVHNEEYLWLGLQPNNTAMTPNGQMYYAVDVYVDDFASTGDHRLEHLFIHEMGHVWQHELGYPVKRKGLFLHPKSLWGLLYDAYEYQLDPLKKLADYNMEQQPDIIADYAMLYIFNTLTAKNRYPKNDFDIVLSNFLRDPSDASNLPKS